MAKLRVVLAALSTGGYGSCAYRHGESLLMPLSHNLLDQRDSFSQPNDNTHYSPEVFYFCRVLQSPAGGRR
jgi:hypothetical protein